jgi:nucleotide-binding universal stress UspA family protein
MDNHNLSLLLCTNGDEDSRPVLEYGVWMAGLLKTSVVLLGVIEERNEKINVERLLNETSDALQKAKIPYEVRIDNGRGSVVIARHAHAGNYLTVVGRMGRPAWQRVVQGRSFRRILERVATPILYVPEARLRLKRMLICLGGLGYAASMEHLGLYLARASKAHVTLLHVVEPITLDYPTAREVQNHWLDILNTDTPQGRNLGEAMEEVRKAGLEAEFKVRHGSIVHEIVEEARQGDYDLVGMGSAYSAHSLRHLYMPNVTAEVAETLECPIFTVRLGYELME